MYYKHRCNYKKWIRYIKFLYPIFFENNKRIRTYWLLSFLFILVAMCLNIITPILLKIVIGALAKTDSTPTKQIILLLLSYGITWTISQVVAQGRQVLMFRVTERASRILSLKIMNHIFHLPSSWHINKKTGVLVGSTERAHSSIPNLIWGPLFYIIPISLEVVIISILMSYWYGIKFLFIMIIIVALFVLYSSISIHWSIRAQRESNTKSAEVNSRINEVLLNFETIKYFRNEEYELKQADEALKEREDVVTRRLISAEIVSLGQSVIVGGGLIFMICFSGLKVVAHQFTIGDFVLINTYILQFVLPLSALGYLFRSINKAMVDMEHVVALFDQPIEGSNIVAVPPKSAAETDRRIIRFEHVYFNYAPDCQTLNNISFSLSQGKTMALIGPTGSGKSTIAKLLLKLYIPQQGIIKIGLEDMQMQRIKDSDLRLGIVPQDIMLFNNTLLYNLTYAKPSSSWQAIEEAVEIAQLKSFIKNLPQGYATPIGERGLKLSGGEKQRLAIARAILMCPDIYIFDEATSALDVKTERAILANLKKLSQAATMIFITHRLSTIKNADHIVVLDHGKVVAQGDHASLLTRCALYANLCATQFGGEEQT